MTKPKTVTICSDCPHFLDVGYAETGRFPSAGPRCGCDKSPCERKFITQDEGDFEVVEGVWVNYHCQLHEPLPGRKEERFRKPDPNTVRRFTFEEFFDMMEVEYARGIQTPDFDTDNSHSNLQQGVVVL